MSDSDDVEEIDDPAVAAGGRPSSAPPREFVGARARAAAPAEDLGLSCGETDSDEEGEEGEEGESESEEEENGPPEKLSEYELERRKNMDNNHRVLVSLGLEDGGAAALRGGRKGKGKGEGEGEGAGRGARQGQGPRADAGEEAPPRRRRERVRRRRR